MTVAVDPITLEVMRHALYSIADEMVAGLVRASYSTNIKDRRDCSCAIYNLAGEVVAMGEFGGTPLHLGTMHSALQTALEVFPPASLDQGDTIILNTPYPAGPGHLNDVCIIAPIFVDGNVFAFAASQSHRVDIGGFAPGSMPFGVTEIFQEGLQIPPILIQRRGQLDERLLAFINQNLRTPEENRGDLMAQIAANTIAQRRMAELAGKYGSDLLATYMRELLDYAERRMRAGLTALPAGVYSAEDVMEGDGIHQDPLTIRVTLTVADGSVQADFTATDPQTAGPLNCRWPSVAACVYYVLKCVVDPQLPPNAGAYRPISVLTRPGSLLEAQFPAAVCNANIITTQRLVDTLLRALLQAVPERVLAACSGTMNLLNIGGLDPRGGAYYNYIETYGGGQGAAEYLEFAIQANSATVGAGTFRPRYQTVGQDPQRVGRLDHFDWPVARVGHVVLDSIHAVAIVHAYTRLTLSSDRQTVRPWGVFGGQEASGSSCTVESADGLVRQLPSKVTTFLTQGDRLRTVTPGGGGWGDPLLRDPESVWRDVIEGLISIDRARDVYGVVVDSRSGRPDVEATRIRRRQLHAHPGD